MDWHSSGITTSVIGALKRGLTPLSGELGIHVCGGRGKHSRQTPHELVTIGDQVGFDGADLARSSRLVAKVDSAAVQDGFDLYLHGFIVTDDGKWVVVQQGMNGDLRQARRYHWLSEGLTSFVDQPHAAIDGPGQGKIINITDRRADRSRRAQVDVLSSLGPDRIVQELEALSPAVTESAQLSFPYLLRRAYPRGQSAQPCSAHVSRAVAPWRPPLWRLLYDDAGELAADRPNANKRDVCGRRSIRFRNDGCDRDWGHLRGMGRWSTSTGVRRGLHATALRGRNADGRTARRHEQGCVVMRITHTAKSSHR